MIIISSAAWNNRLCLTTHAKIQVLLSDIIGGGITYGRWALQQTAEYVQKCILNMVTERAKTQFKYQDTIFRVF